MGKMEFDENVYNHLMEKFKKYNKNINEYAGTIDEKLNYVNGNISYKLSYGFTHIIELTNIASLIKFIVNNLATRSNEVLEVLEKVGNEINSVDNYILSKSEEIDTYQDAYISAPVSEVYVEPQNSEQITEEVQSEDVYEEPKNDINVTIAEVIDYIPKGYGKIHSRSVWNRSWEYDSLDVIRALGGENGVGGGYIGTTKYGIVTYGQWFAAAMAKIIGKPGDMILCVQDNGTVYPVMIADTKNPNDPTMNEWGHYGGQCMAEFQVFKNSDANNDDNVIGPNNEFNHSIVKTIKVGNVFDNPELIDNAEAAFRAANLGNLTFISANSI